jgi:hypothetical protein
MGDNLGAVAALLDCLAALIIALIELVLCLQAAARATARGRSQHTGRPAR